MEGGGHVKFYPYEKVGGHTKFWYSFYSVALSFSHIVGGARKVSTL